MGNPVVHFEITAPDIGRLQDFYSKVFAWKIAADNPFKYGMTDTQSGGKGINGGIGEGSARITFYIEVPDIDRALAAVKAAGGTVTMEKTQVPGGPTLAHFSDPAGFVVGLIQG